MSELIKLTPSDPKPEFLKSFNDGPTVTLIVRLDDTALDPIRSIIREELAELFHDLKDK